MTDATLRDRLARLTARLGSGPKLGLAGVRSALATLGHPERDLAVAHVAGTNGKGSVCAMVEAVAEATGLRTGLFSSPHLCRFNERIRIGGADVTDAQLNAALGVALGPELPELTFFETLTVAALWLFRELHVDLAILEVGLGGRLDATNVVDEPLGCAVVTVGLDHVELLGHELGQIAREKAGILKRGCPAIIGHLGPEAARATLDVARAVGASPIWRVLPRDSSRLISHASAGDRATGSIEYEWSASQGLCLDGSAGRWRDLRPSLVGPHQAHNAAVAVGLVHALGRRWPELDNHLAEGIARARWPGRLETIVQDGVRVVIDCAHNPHAVAALAAWMEAELTPERTSLLFGAVADKPWRAMLERLAPLAARRYYTIPLAPIGGRRSAEPQEIAEAAEGVVETRPRDAIARALAEARAGDTVLVAGSVFLAGAVRAALLGLAEDRIVPA